MAWKVARALLTGVRRQSTATVAAPTARCPFAPPPPSAGEMPPASAVKGQVLSYDDIPTPKGLPLIGTSWDLLKTGAMSNLHEYCIKRHNELGSVYKETLGVVEAVFVADPKIIRYIYKNDGPYPRHLVPEPWTLYNNDTDTKRGLFFMDGEEWYKCRQGLNKVFLQNPKQENSEAFGEIVNDVMTRWKGLTRKNNGELKDLEMELYKWSIESLGAMIFGRRLGCLNDDGRNISNEFVKAVQAIFNESANMTLISPKFAKDFRLPVWRRFVKAAATSLKSSRQFVEEALAESERLGSVKQLNGFMEHLPLTDNDSRENFTRIVNDLFIAAAHTTSPATQWVLYLLATNKECQEKVLNEIQQVVPNGEMVGPQHLTSLPYVKAVVKESNRMYPVAPFLTRIFNRDMMLGKYLIPQGKLVLMSMFTLSRNDEHFPNANVFRPERWIRKPGPKRQVIESHACLPFGLGARSCVGRKVAEENMHLMVARIVQQYKLDLLNKNKIEVKLRMITMPSESIRLKLTEREAV